MVKHCFKLTKNINIVNLLNHEKGKHIKICNIRYKTININSILIIKIKHFNSNIYYNSNENIKYTKIINLPNDTTDIIYENTIDKPD
jgi:hypothetical protein